MIIVNNRFILRVCYNLFIRKKYDKMKNIQKKSKLKEILTVLFGLCIVVVRVLIPKNFGVNNTTVILEVIGELCILIGVILLNKEKIKIILKNAKNDKISNFIKKSIVIGLICFVFFMIDGAIVSMVFKKNVLLSDIMADFAKIIPIMGIISQVLIAPVTEELVFRLTLHDLIPNKVIFIIVSSLLFAFIHDWFYFSGGLIFYFIAGIILSFMYLFKAKDIRYMIGGHIFINILTNIIQFLKP